jgi:hypothetical protein
MRCTHVGISMAVALALAGCGVTGSLVMPEPRPLGRGFETFRTHAGVRSDQALPGDLPDQETLSLEQAQALALMRNSGLESFSHNVRLAEARALQASGYDGAKVEHLRGGAKVKHPKVLTRNTESGTAVIRGVRGVHGHGEVG